MSDTLLVSTRKGLFEVRRHSSGWSIQQVSFIGQNVTLTLVDVRDGTWYAATKHDVFGPQLHRSEDDGASWMELPVPSYPDAPASEDERALPSSLRLVWSLAAGGADRTGELWAGTVPGGLFRSRDRGESWELIESLWNHPGRAKWFGRGSSYPGIHSVLIDPRDSNRVLVAVSCGGIWESRDAGENWALRSSGMRAAYMPEEQASDPGVQDPHCLVACAGDFDALWVQHRSGIWRSCDGGGSWEEITEAGPSTFGFTVAVHPQQPDTAYFVPAVSDKHRYPEDGRVVVTRTRDGGRSFDVLRRGLPQDHAYDIVYRHALDIDQSGQRLALGSTTGNLWVSEDGGDTFVNVGGHLPPIYAVQFVPTVSSG